VTALGSVAEPITVVFEAALRGAPCDVVGLGPVPSPVPVQRWRDTVDDSDRAVLAHCTGPTLDVGCGPGRMSAHLAARGHCVLGLDVVGEAVAQARGRGVAALKRDVFAPLPGEGQWESALLADGNIGIGGDPVRLLRRLHDLLAPGGRVVADLAPHGTGMRTLTVWLRTADRRSHPFPWAVVGVEAMAAVACAAELQLHATHVHSGRWFAVLGKA
jgi:SAM-dependent methyltransferase